jgi:hypothetical protein
VGRGVSRWPVKRIAATVALAYLTVAGRREMRERACPSTAGANARLPFFQSPPCYASNELFVVITGMRRRAISEAQWDEPKNREGAFRKAVEVMRQRAKHHSPFADSAAPNGVAILG